MSVHSILETAFRLEKELDYMDLLNCDVACEC